MFDLLISPPTFIPQPNTCKPNSSTVYFSINFESCFLLSSKGNTFLSFVTMSLSTDSFKIIFLHIVVYIKYFQIEIY